MTAAFLKFFDILPGWVWAAILAGTLVITGGLITAQTLRLASANTATAQAKTALADERRARADENLVRQEAYASDLRQVMRLQSTHAARQQEIIHAHATLAQSRQAALAAARARNVSLRGEIAAFAAGGGGEGQGDATACGGGRDRAATLGDLLNRTLDLASRHTDAAEKHAGEVRLLKDLITNDRATVCGGP